MYLYIIKRKDARCGCIVFARNCKEARQLAAKKQSNNYYLDSSIYVIRKLRSNKPKVVMSGWEIYK